MGQLIIKREKVRTLFADFTICYVNDHMVCELKSGEEKACEIDSGIIEFKCFVPRGPMSEVYKLDITNKNSIQIMLKSSAKAIEINVFDQEAIIDISKSSQPSIESINADIKTICDTTNVSTQEAHVALMKYGFNVNVAVKELGGPENILQEISRRPAPAIFTPTQAVGGYFGINERTRQWAVGKGLIPSLKNTSPYNYDDIIDFELLEDGTSVTRGGLGRAAVGGLLFGSTGAIVGGITGGKKAKQKCTSLMVKITVNNIHAPVVYIKLITAPIDKSSFTYRAAFENAQAIVSMLQLICCQCDVQKETKVSTPPSKEVSSADEIRKFKALMDEGIITEEEFNAKKMQLLGI